MSKMKYGTWSNIEPDRQSAYIRLVIGLFQGILLYLLYNNRSLQSWFTPHKEIFGALTLMVLYAPIMAISSIQHLSNKRLALSVLGIILMTSTLGFYDSWRMGYVEEWRKTNPTPLIIFFTGVIFYITQSINLSSAYDKKWISSYKTYFEVSWKLAIQILFSFLFVGILWLILYLSSSLFMLIKIEFLQNLIRSPSFSIPISSLAFSFSFHITDIRPSLIKGIQSLILILLSWLLPIIVLSCSAFFLCLTFTGLSLLWETKTATAILLAASATLIVLINTTYKSGDTAIQTAVFFKYITRLAAFLLLPITLLGAYALGLRVSEYGWTVERVAACACLLISFCYAAGYSYAATQQKNWMSALESTNIYTAFFVVVMLFSIFTPIADPARISVNSQINRLISGTIPINKFDFEYLKFSGERYGLDALNMLKESAQGEHADTIKLKATAALNKKREWEAAYDQKTTSQNISTNITLHPNTKKIPQSFIEQDWNTQDNKWKMPECIRSSAQCDGYLINVTDDENNEIMLIDGKGATFFTQLADKKWVILGTIPSYFLNSCKDLKEKLEAEKYSTPPAEIHDLEVGNVRLHIVVDDDYNKLPCKNSNSSGCEK